MILKLWLLHDCPNIKQQSTRLSSHTKELIVYDSIVLFKMSDDVITLQRDIRTLC